MRNGHFVYHENLCEFGRTFEFQTTESVLTYESLQRTRCCHNYQKLLFNATFDFQKYPKIQIWKSNRHLTLKMVVRLTLQSGVQKYKNTKRGQIFRDDRIQWSQSSGEFSGCGVRCSGPPNRTNDHKNHSKHRYGVVVGRALLTILRNQFEEIRLECMAGI